MTPRDDAVDQYIAALLDASPLPDAATVASASAIAGNPASATNTVCGESPHGVADGAMGYHLCSVSGLQLAVPKRAVEPVGLLPPMLAAADASPPWLLGSVDFDGRVCHVVDLARIIAPKGLLRAAPERARFLACGHWLLGVDRIEGELVLAAAQVRWRENPTSRPWLAGMASEPLCAVLNVTGLCRLLSQELPHDAT